MNGCCQVIVVNGGCCGPRQQDLLNDWVVSGAGDPTHTPNLPNQIYFDTVGHVEWYYYAGAWH